MEKKILLVDDDRDLAEIIRDMLKTYGYEVKIVESCEETFEILKKEQFSLMILDINLPDGTGFEVLKELRRVSKVPVIFASARTSEDDKRFAQSFEKLVLLAQAKEGEQNGAV